MALVRMDIQTVVVGGGPVASLVILRTRTGDKDVQLPIRIGAIEATSISMGVNGAPSKRPMTHDLLLSTIKALDATLESITIAEVEGTTFFAHLNIRLSNDDLQVVDARPSDALALAVRTGAPIFASEDVVDAATLPDFSAVEESERQHSLEEFHSFVENLSPSDFSEAVE
ncbi:MAG TPA: bifunctional nuclease family protein [Atopobiaceae bacterium]|nr:bifunctional nuclease family protein [Atopobiaceae bacterium]